MKEICEKGNDQFYLRKDPERLVWCFERAERELNKPTPDPLLAQIEKMMERVTQWQGSATELAAQLDETINPNTLARRLNILAGQLLNEYAIRYENTHSRSGSRITLTKMLADE